MQATVFSRFMPAVIFIHTYTHSHSAHSHTLLNMHSVLWMGMTLLCFLMHLQHSSPPSLAALQTHFMWKNPLNRCDLWLREHPLAKSFKKHTVCSASVKTQAGCVVANGTKTNSCFLLELRVAVKTVSSAFLNISHGQTEGWLVVMVTHRSGHHQ